MSPSLRVKIFCPKILHHAISQVFSLINGVIVLKNVLFVQKKVEIRISIFDKLKKGVKWRRLTNGSNFSLEELGV